MPPSGRLYTGGLAELLGMGLSLDVLQVLLVQSRYRFDATHRTVSDVAGDELTVEGYYRYPLAGARIVRDDAAGMVYLDAQDLDCGDLGPGERIGGAVLARWLGADDLSPLIAFYPLGVAGTTGGPVTLEWAPPEDGRVLSLTGVTG